MVLPVRYIVNYSQKGLGWLKKKTNLKGKIKKKKSESVLAVLIYPFSESLKLISINPEKKLHQVICSLLM